MQARNFGIFRAIIFCLLTASGATAAIQVDSADMNGAGHGQYHVVKDESGSIGSKIFTLDTSGQQVIEVKAQDEAAAMSWDDAILAVRKHGEGWRLPTIAELRWMYGQRQLIDGFDDEDYWSSTQQDVNSAWIQGFRAGDQDRYNKQSKLKIRAVKSR